MLSIAAAFAPIWLITGSGMLASRSVTFADRATGLTVFAFHVAMPAALFTTLSQAALDRIPVRPLLAVVSGTVVVSVIAYLSVMRRHEGVARPVMTAMSAGYLNSGNLGIPVAFHVIGDTLLIAAVMLVQTIVITPLVLLRLDADGSGSASRTWSAPLRNPIVVASGGALALNAAGVEVPAFVMEPVAVLGAAAVPVALFALGLGLLTAGESTRSVSAGETVWLVALKVVAHPLIALLIGWLLLGIQGRALGAVVLIAALPTAQVVSVYADRYDVAAPLARRVVVWTSAVAMVTLIGVAAWFGMG